MALCPDCKHDMMDGVSCVVVPFWNGALPVPYEPDYEVVGCHDCRTPRGGYHHPGCDMERCPHGGQAISCDECTDERLELVPWRLDPVPLPVVAGIVETS